MSKWTLTYNSRFAFWMSLFADAVMAERNATIDANIAEGEA